MTLIIGIAGKKRVGKDTLAGYIQQRWEFYGKEKPYIMSFADTLKGMLRPMLMECGLSSADIQQIETTDMKDQLVLPVVDCTYRKLAQTLGTEWGRFYIDPNIWVKILLHKASRHKVVIVPDVRFPNEAQAIRCHGVLVHLTRREVGSTDSHSSEAGVPVIEGDYQIANDFGLKGLLEEAERFVFTTGNKRFWLC